MKVYELLNKLKGTNSTPEVIKAWSYMNRVPPCILEDGFELDCEYPESLRKVQVKVCSDVQMDCMKCLDTFFEMEIEGLEDKV